jgi:hypothetical protein
MDRGQQLRWLVNWGCLTGNSETLAKTNEFKKMATMKKREVRMEMLPNS